MCLNKANQGYSSVEYCKARCQLFASKGKFNWATDSSGSDVKKSLNKIRFLF